MKNIVILLIISIIGFTLYKSLAPQTPIIKDSDANLILFWGDGCPHCETVKKYITDNKLETKVKISYKEVYYNKTNQNLLTDYVKKCPEIDSKSGVGVPLAWDTANSRCLQGDKPIIDWLNSRVLK